MSEKQKIDYAHMTYGPKAKRYKNYLSNCPICDGELDELDKECKYCGYDLTEINKQHEEKLSADQQIVVNREIDRLTSVLIFEEQKKDRRKLSVEALLVLFVIIVGASAFVLFRFLLTWY